MKIGTPKTNKQCKGKRIGCHNVWLSHRVVVTPCGCHNVWLLQRVVATTCGCPHVWLSHRVVVKPCAVTKQFIYISHHDSRLDYRLGK